MSVCLLMKFNEMILVTTLNHWVESSSLSGVTLKKADINRWSAFLFSNFLALVYFMLFVGKIEIIMVVVLQGLEP